MIKNCIATTNQKGVRHLGLLSLIIIFLIIDSPVFSQTSDFTFKLDSINKFIEDAPQDSSKMYGYIELTRLYASKRDKKNAREELLSALELFRKDINRYKGVNDQIHRKRGVVILKTLIEICYSFKEYDKTIEFAKECIEVMESVNDLDQAIVYNKWSFAHFKKREYDEALIAVHNAVRAAERLPVMDKGDSILLFSSTIILNVARSAG